MNKLIEYFAKQGVFITLISIFVFIVGLLATFDIRREVFPNVDMDMVSVTVLYPGASAESMEKLVTNPLEQDLLEVEGLKNRFSVSSEGISFFLFQVDSDHISTKEAKDDIESIVDAFSDLPQGAKKPVVKMIESKSTPTIEIAISSKKGKERVREASRRLKEEILDKVPEVARIPINGLTDREFKVEASHEKLAYYQVSLQEVIFALKSNNISLPGGTIEGQASNQYEEFIVRTIGEFSHLGDVANTVVRSNSMGEVIRIKDLAKVTRGFAKSKVAYRINGQDSMSLTVLKKEAADSILLVEKVKKVVEASRDRLLDDIDIRYINDQSFYVKRRISVLSSNLLVGLFLVLLVLSLILPVRIGLVTAFGIPFSFLGTMILFHIYGLSINLIGMMGLIIVVGMLVDDAIVVTENAQRHREAGKEPLLAAIDGTKEVWAPVTVSVLTTVMAFAPLMFMSGIFGKFVANIPLGVIVALLISLVECFFILPHHVGHFTKSSSKKISKGALSGVWDQYVVAFYQKMIHKALKFRYVLLILFGGFFALSLYHYHKNMQFVMFPPGGVENFLINVEAKEGSSLERTKSLIAPIEKVVMGLSRDELKDVTSKVGEQSYGVNDPRSKQGPQFAQIKVYLTPETGRQRTAAMIIEDLKKKMPYDSSLRDLSFAQISGGPPVGKPVSIGVRGDDYGKILPVSKKLEEILRGVKGVSDIQNSYVVGKKELHIKVDDKKLASAMLTRQDVGTAVRAAIDGVVASSIRGLDEEIDIRVSLSQKERGDVNTLKDILIPNKRGALIPLENVASLQPFRGVSSYQHRSNKREVVVSAEIDTALTSSTKVNALVAKKVADLLKKEKDITLHFGGENQDTKESMESLFRAFLLAVFGISMILIMLFKNIYQPIVVMSTIPLGIVSVIWSFYFHDMPLSFLGMIGVVALSGVVVNNAIVFVDFVNQNRKKGLVGLSSISDAAQKRLRPIFLTTVTTVAGILPTAYGIGGKDAFVVPVAMALGWGMFFGSFMTAFILPCVVAVSDDVVHFVKRVFKT